MMTDQRRRERPERARVAPSRTAGARTATTSTRTTSRLKARSTPRRSVRAGHATAPAKQATRADQAPPEHAGVTRTNRRQSSPSVRRRRSRLAIGVFAVLFTGFLVAFVYPTGTFLRQRSQLSAAENRLQILETQTKALNDDSARLHTDAEIERVAREQYGLTRPGETPYVLVPAPTPPPAPAG